MSEPERVAAALQRLHLAGSPLGLARAPAERLAGALARGEPLAPTILPLEPGLRAALGAEGLADPPAALLALLPGASLAEGHTLALRSAAVYPAVVAATLVLCASVVFGVGFPALAALPGGAASPLWPLVGLAGSVAALGVLAGLVEGRWRPNAGWDRVDGFRWIDATRVLVAAGVDVAVAMRAAAAAARPGVRAAAEGLAAALVAGGEGSRSAAPLLDDDERTMLLAGAREGAVAPTLEALTDHRRRALEAEIAAAQLGVQAVALGIAGLGLLCLGGSWYSAYLHTVAGG